MPARDLSVLLAPGIDRHFNIEYDEYPSVISELFHVETTKSRVIQSQGWIRPGLPERIRPGETVPHGDFGASFGKKYIVLDYALGFAIPFVDVEDDQYGVINRIVPMQGGAFAQSFRTLEEICAARFFGTVGFQSGTSVPGMADGVSLFNIAHPVSAQNPSVTVANRPTTDVALSATSLKAALIALTTQMAPNNLHKIRNDARLLVISPQNRFVARQLLQTDWEPNSPNLNQNVIRQDGLRALEWPYFDTNNGAAWFVLGQRHHLYWYVRQRPKTIVDKDTQRLSWIVVQYARFAWGADDWRGTYGTYGA